MSELAMRMGFPFVFFLLMVVLETRFPARISALNIQRFRLHAIMTVAGTLLSRLFLVGGLVSVSVWAEKIGFGLFHFVPSPNWVAILISIVILDLAIWAQHVALHRVPFLWRLHRVHHSDVSMDVSTALRFHPFEILGSLIFKAAVIVLLGTPPVAVITFEILLSACAMWTHANIALPKALDQVLRVGLVTPSFHLVHHNRDPAFTNSNFGFSTSLWDRVFGTYIHQAHSDESTIGLENWREPQDQTLLQMLTNPFK